MSPYITYAERLMRPLAEQLAREQQKIRVISDSAEKRLVATNIRKRVRRRLEDQLKAAYPEHFTAKQSSSGKPSILQSYWRIYPVPEIDAYLHGIEHYSLIATLSSHNKIEHAIVYFPDSQTLLTGSNGAGAYHEQRRLRIKQDFESTEAFIACNSIELSGWRRRLLGSSKRVIHTGSTFGDMLYLLSGKVDIMLAQGIAAPIVELVEFFVRESGGITASVEIDRGVFSSLASSASRMDQLGLDYSIQSA